MKFYFQAILLLSLNCCLVLSQTPYISKVWVSDNGKGKEAKIETTSMLQNTIYLRMKVSAPDALCTFSFSLDGTEFRPFGKAFKAVAGGWIGAKAGLFCLAGTRGIGHADFDWFRVE